MTTTYQQAIEHGVARVEYVWHVGGLPWFACTSVDVLTALESDTTTRRAILGGRRLRTAGAANVYLADGMPGFASLLRAQIGTQTWRLADDEGQISGGSWSLSLADSDTATDWAHNLAGSVLWGYPGLSCYAAPDSSEAIPSGILTSTESIDTSSIAVQWQSPEDVASLVDDAISADGYALLWAGHECLAVNAVSGTYPDMVYDVAQLASADGRGLYRTRPQIHYGSTISGLDPVISADPGSPIGRHCYLWGLTLDADGAVVDYALEREGVIAGVIRERGILRVSCNSPLSCLREVVTPVASRAALRGYSFSRGSPDIAPDHDDLNADFGLLTYTPLQSPHLVIHELYDIVSGETRASNCAVWLCPVNDSVFFETWEDLVLAINAELDAAWADTSTNGSAGGHKTVDYTDSGSWFAHWQMAPDGRLYVAEHGVETGYAGYAQGPIGLLCRTGREYTGNGQRATVYDWHEITTVWREANQLNRLGGWEYAAQSCWAYAAGTDVPADTATGKPWQQYPYTVIGTAQRRLLEGEVPEELLRPAYLYQSDWRYETDTYYGDNMGPLSFRAAPWRDYWTTAEELHCLPGTDVSAYSAGVQVHLGASSVCQVTPLLLTESGGVAGSGTDDPTIAPSSYASDSLAPYSFALDGVGAMRCGLTLWYGPLWHSLRYGVLPAQDDVFGVESEIDVSQGGTLDDGMFDPWQINLRNSGVIRTDTLSEMIQLLMGDSTAYGTLPAARCLHWVPFFVDESPDFISLYDYDSLDDNAAPLSDDLVYEIDTTAGVSVDIGKAIADEFVLHRVGQVLEYDADSHRWRIRFRRIGPPNATDAAASGRTITEASLVRGDPGSSDNMSAAPRYERIEVTIGEGAPVTITDRSTRILPGAGDVRCLSLSPQLSRSPRLESGDTTAATILGAELGDGLLRYLVSPVYEQEARAVWSSRFRLALGRELLVSRADVRHPYTGAHGISEIVGRVTSVQQDIARSTIKITYDLAGRPVYGLSPAVLVLGGTVSGDHVTIDIDTETTAHAYSRATDRPDAYWLDCYTWDAVSGTLAAGTCSCGDYRVIAVEYDEADPEWYEFTASISGSTLTLTEVTPGEAANWDDEVRYVLIYGHWDDIEDCQKRFVHFGDPTGVLGADDSPARVWL